MRDFTGDSGWDLEFVAVCDVLAVEVSGNKGTRNDGVEVNGIEIDIKKTPMRAYISFVQRGEKMPPSLMEELFPSMTGVDVLARVVAQKGENLKRQDAKETKEVFIPGHSLGV